jgi:hypothetical protein
MDKLGNSENLVKLERERGRGRGRGREGEREDEDPGHIYSCVLVPIVILEIGRLRQEEAEEEKQEVGEVGEVKTGSFGKDPRAGLQKKDGVQTAPQDGDSGSRLKRGNLIKQSKTKQQTNKQIMVFLNYKPTFLILWN